MNFYDYAKDIISERLEKRDTLKKVVENIKDASANGRIAFYPCTKYTRIILNNVIIHAPEILPRVIGCFDKSDEANMGKGIDVYSIERLDEFKDKLSLLVVASNAFYTKELSDIKKVTDYDGPILRTSYFDISLGDMEDKEILSKIEEVYDLLADQKSKITYLTTWISLLLNDEGLTYLFEGENEPSAQFGNYIFQGMDDPYREENPADLYQMRYVTLEKGDIVFDIGAFKGDTAIFFANSVSREGGVYSFEPVKDNYDYLVKNIEINGLQDIVTSVNKGCSDKSGVLKLVSGKSGTSWSFLSEDDDIDEKAGVISIDDFVALNNISKLDFIKMDVEGWEYRVILGALNTIKRFKPKLVIPLYHNSCDLITIPLLINKISKYELYFRCKYQGPYGFILYGIRK